MFTLVRGLLGLVDISGVPISVSNPLPVLATAGATPAYTTIFTGVFAVPLAAGVLPTNTCKRLTLRSIIDNTAIIYIGVSGVSPATGYSLYPGDSMPPLLIANTNMIFAVSTAGGQVLNFFGEDT